MRCGLPHPSVNFRGDENGYICAPCVYFDLVAIEKATLKEAIEFLRDRGLCAYCGDVADEIDHVVPRCIGLPTYTLPACGECNRMAGAELFVSFEEKRDHIRDRRARRYRKLLAMPEWDRSEIEELSGKLRRSVQSCLEAKRLVEQQMAWDWYALCRKSMDCLDNA